MIVAIDLHTSLEGGGTLRGVSILRGCMSGCCTAREIGRLNAASGRFMISAADELGPAQCTAA